MSVAGIDVGDACSGIAVARKRGVDVLLNKESKRETPTLLAPRRAPWAPTPSAR